MPRLLYEMKLMAFLELLCTVGTVGTCSHVRSGNIDPMAKEALLGQLQSETPRDLLELRIRVGLQSWNNLQFIILID